jgi:4a-hydroxytetrahydrobiopterin dehydratase
MVLTEEEIKEKIRAVRGWEYREGKLVKSYRFKDFMTAVEFINKIAVVAESLNHHPDMEVHYNQVTIMSWSHDVEGITDRDFKLIKSIDPLAVELI